MSEPALFKPEPGQVESLLPMLETTGKRRRELAEESEAAVREAFAGDLPRD